MLGNIGGPGFLILILLAVFLWGPEKLPQALANVRKFIAKARQMASNAAADLSREVGTEIKPEDLNPKTFVRKHVLSEEDQQMLTNPLKSTMRDLEDGTKPLQDELRSTTRSVEDARRNVNGRRPSRTASKTVSGDATETSAPSESAGTESAASRYDDAT